MAEAVQTLDAGRTPCMLASPSAGLGPSESRVVTGGGESDDGGPDGSTSGDSSPDHRSRRSQRSHQRRRPGFSSSDSISRSDGETVRRALVDFQIPVHKFGESLLSTLTYCTFTRWTTRTRHSKCGCVYGFHTTGINLGFPWKWLALTGPSRSSYSPSCADISGPATTEASGRAACSTCWAPF